MYEYKCKILRVVDGDTVDIDIDLGFGVWLKKERVRMMGIDTPESRTRDKEEKKFGLAAKDFVKSKMPVGSVQILKTEIDRSGEDKKGKFGRILGVIFANATTLESDGRLDQVYRFASKNPSIPLDAYMSDGRPYTLNWELVMMGLGNVYLNDIIWDSDSKRGETGP